MKIEIITLHRITNFGSMLQTYATQTAVEKLGHEAEILDFVPDGITFKRGCWPKNNAPVWKKILKLPPLFVVNFIQYNILDKFLGKYIHLTPRRYGCYQEILDNVPIADVYLSGSDQVWNTQNNNPKDDLKAYYLGFVPMGKKRIAYAGSFGKNIFSIEESEIIREYIAKYDYVSVREDDGLRILEHHGFYSGVHVVDPTLLLNADEWRSFVKKNAPIEKYVFVYNLNRSALIKNIAKMIAEEKGLKIVNFADSLDFIPGAKNRMFNTPMDFVNYIANAEVVVTDSFHGTAFSINLSKQFVCVKAPRYNSRIESILRQTGLYDTRMVSSVEDALDASRQQIDYTRVNTIIEEARRLSYKYLRNAIES